MAVTLGLWFRGWSLTHWDAAFARQQAGVTEDEITAKGEATAARCDDRGGK